MDCDLQNKKREKRSSPCFPIRVRPAASTVFPNLAFRVKSLPTSDLDLQARLDDLFTANYTTNQINVEDLFNRFHSLIIQTKGTHAPVVKYSRKQKRLHQKPWITKELLVSIKKKQKMHKSHYIKGSSCEKYLYKLYSNLLNRLERLAKRLHYHNQVNACKNNPKKTWDILRSLLPNKSISSATNSISINGEIVSDPAAILEKFNSHFSNIGQSLATSITNDSHINDFHSYLKSPCSSYIYLHPTSPQEITKLLYNLDSNKASGYDDISPFILKTAIHIISLPLSIILNLCISNGVFPNNLKVAKVIPVYKYGCPNEPGNYRPISLLSSIAKIFERVILNRMVSFLERNNLIISTQFGFCHKHSTIHPILDLITESYQNIEEKRFSTLLLPDIRKAFDSVSRPTLLKKLEFYGIRGVSNTLLDSYLRERKQFISINNTVAIRNFVMLHMESPKALYWDLYYFYYISTIFPLLYKRCLDFLPMALPC